MRHRIVLEPSDAEVRQPMRADRFREAARHAVVVVNRRTIQTARPKARTSEGTQAAKARQVEIVKAEASENLEVSRSVVINSCVKRILIVRTVARRNEVVVDSRYARTCTGNRNRR